MIHLPGMAKDEIQPGTTVLPAREKFFAKDVPWNQSLKCRQGF
jgi:hypothetical protein